LQGAALKGWNAAALAAESRPRKPAAHWRTTRSRQRTRRRTRWKLRPHFDLSRRFISPNERSQDGQRRTYCFHGEASHVCPRDMFRRRRHHPA
jgi:hypothetical protein